MQSLIMRISFTALEAVVAGLAIAGTLTLIRKIQIAFGGTDDKPQKPANFPHVQ